MFLFFPETARSTVLSSSLKQHCSIYINDVEMANTASGSAPTNGVALNPVITAGLGGSAGTYNLLSTQYTHLASNRHAGKTGLILTVRLNKPTNTQTVSNFITGNLTNI